MTALRKRLTKRLMGFLCSEDSVCVCNSYDVVGDIAIVRLTERSRTCSEKVAEAVMAAHRSVKTVLAQASAVSGEFRVRRLEYVAGERKTCTVHRESGCLFSVDVEKCYFSPRLSYERMRVARLVEDGETVVNMFAGVGCFSIVMAKHAEVEKVYSIDINPEAVRLMRENVRVNRVYGRVVPILGDAGEVVEERLRHVADRVLMPLPAKSLEYLPYALLALKERGGWVHYYGFEHAAKCEDAVDKARVKVSEKLLDICDSFEIPFGRVVRATGPNWYQVVLDVKAKPGEACTRLG
jgi:tRNA (guanine37-N1)-methyltransferase